MNPRRVVLLNTAAPDRPNGSMVRYGSMVRAALEQYGGGEFSMEEVNLAPLQSALQRFPGPLQTPLRYLCIAARARRVLPRQRDRILHLLDGSHAYLLDAVRRLSAPLVITVHDLIPLLRLRGELGASRPGRGGACLIRRAALNLARADALVAVSATTRKDLIRCAGAAPERVHIARSAVTSPVAAAPATRPRSELPYILHVAGNNTFYKNRQGVVDVFTIIRRSMPVTLKMAGAPPDAALLEKARSCGASAAIEFLPNIPETELAALYRDAAFLLFPSFYEGFGWPPLEAMVQGCPVVCSDAGSLPEIVGEAGLMAAPHDAASLAAHGLQLLRDPELRRRLVASGLQRARQFTLEAMATGLVTVYRAAGESRGKRP